MESLPKYLGLLGIVTGIPLLIMNPSENNAVPLLVGLFIVLVSKEKRDDERSISLKNSSTFIAVIISYSIKLISANLYSHQIISFQLADINYFLILLFSLAIVIFYCRMFLPLK